MKARYSLVHLTNASCAPPAFVYAAAEAGYDCVSFRGIPTREKKSINCSPVKESITGKMPFDFAGNPQMLVETRQAARDSGVVLHDSENARIFDGVDVSDYEPDLEAAAELGIKHILTNIWTKDKHFYTEELDKLCEFAEKYGLTVNVEFVTWASVKNLSETVELLRNIGRSNVGIVIDMLHFHRSKVMASELDTLPCQWFRYLHLCDCPEEIPEKEEDLIRTGLEERLFPGEGTADILSVVKKLPEAVRGIEVPNPTRMNAMGFMPYIKAALRQTKSYLREVE